jgi:ligand-binding sensor domain-containing protein
LTYRRRLLHVLCGGLLALALLVMAGPASAQEQGPQWRRFTIDDGLAANDVWAVLQAQDGALWFGTNGGGVSRFDGRWTLFSVETTGGGLAGNQVRSILQALRRASVTTAKALGASIGLPTRSPATRSGRWQKWATV